MNRPVTVSRATVLRDDSARVYVQAPCGCTWRVDAGEEDGIGPAVNAALSHAEIGDPCFMPSNITLAPTPDVGEHGHRVPQFRHLDRAQDRARGSAHG